MSDRKLLDLTRYEGHYPAPWGLWNEYVYSGETEVCNKGELRMRHKRAIGTFCEMREHDTPRNGRRSTRHLIADAPALLAEDKALRAEVERLESEAKAKDAEIARLRELLREIRTWVHSDPVRGAFVLASVHGQGVTPEFAQAVDAMWSRVSAALKESP